MLNIGFMEFALIGIVLVLVVGPKELPGMLRNFGRWAGQARRLATTFQTQVNEALFEAERQAGLDETRKELQKIGSLNPVSDIEKAINPLAEDAEQSLEDMKARFGTAGYNDPVPMPLTGDSGDGGDDGPAEAAPAAAVPSPPPATQAAKRAPAAAAPADKPAISASTPAELPGSYGIPKSASTKPRPRLEPVTARGRAAAARSDAEAAAAAAGLDPTDGGGGS